MSTHYSTMLNALPHLASNMDPSSLRAGSGFMGHEVPYVQLPTSAPPVGPHETGLQEGGSLLSKIGGLFSRIFSSKAAGNMATAASKGITRGMLQDDEPPRRRGGVLRTSMMDGNRRRAAYYDDEDDYEEEPPRRRMRETRASNPFSASGGFQAQQPRRLF